MSRAVPTPEEHPVTAMVLHWLHLLSLFVLIFTGIYIHFPWFPGAMGVMRQWHFVSMWIFIATTVVRVYWAFFGTGSAPRGSTVKERDADFFLPEAANKGEFLQTVRYYLFLRRTHPRSGKYNPLQKAAYNVVPFLVLVQAVTGLAIFSPTARYFDALTSAVGGLAQMRALHYLMMFVFIVFLLVHVYLGLAEDIAEFPAMFFGVRRAEPAHEGEDPAAQRQAA